MSSTLLPLASTLGWAGALGTVLAYALVSQRVLSATSRTFQAMNAVSAGLLTVSALAHDSWPSATANTVWVVIAVVALVRSRQLGRTLSSATDAATEPAEVAGERPEDRVGVLSGSR